MWSVCATLYELVSGRMPFPGDNYNAVIFAVGQREPAPLHELRDADRPLATIIERGLNKSRDARFQTARELARALSQFLLARGLETDVCGHSLRARISSAEISLAAEPSSSPLALAPAARREDSSRLAKTEARRSRQRLTDTSPRMRMAALALLAGFMGLAAWRAQGSPQPATAEVSVGPSVIELPDREATTPRLGSAPPVSQVSDVSSPSPPHAAGPKQTSTSQRTAAAKRSKGVASSNALGYDFGL
jgi:hypothetical protein